MKWDRANVFAAVVVAVVVLGSLVFCGLAVVPPGEPRSEFPDFIPTEDMGAGEMTPDGRWIPWTEVVEPDGSKTFRRPDGTNPGWRIEAISE